MIYSFSKAKQEIKGVGHGEGGTTTVFGFLPSLPSTLDSVTERSQRECSTVHKRALFRGAFITKRGEQLQLRYSYELEGNITNTKGKYGNSTTNTVPETGGISSSNVLQGQVPCGSLSSFVSNVNSSCSPLPQKCPPVPYFLLYLGAHDKWPPLHLCHGAQFQIS